MTEEIGPVNLRALRSAAANICKSAGRLDLIDDIYQECLIGAWKARKSFDPSKGEEAIYQYFKGLWAGQDALRETTGWRRKDKYRPRDLDIDLLAPELAVLLYFEEPGFDVIEVEMLAEWVRSELLNVVHSTKRSGDRNQGIVLAALLDGASQADLAREHGVTDSRICQMISAARHALQKRWKGQLLDVG